MNKVVFFSNFFPVMSYSGGSIGAYGMGDCLRSAGFDVSFAFFGTKEEYEKKRNNSDFSVFLIDEGSVQERRDHVAKLLEKLKPDLVWLHPLDMWDYFQPFAGLYPHVVMAGDPMDRIIRFRFKFSSDAAKYWFLRPILRILNNISANKVLRKDSQVLREASVLGISSAYGPGDIQYHRHNSGADIQLCELAFPDLGERKSYTGEKKFLLLGNLTTIHTRYGLDYFFKDIWPLWRKSILTNESEIRLVGAGKMSGRIKVPESQKGFRFVGFAESLEKEFEDTLAAIVTVPIDIGFRTRVIECWMKGIPVIMDSSSARGLPSVKDGYNCLIAKNAREFIQHAKQLLEDEALRSSIGKGGRETFLSVYHSFSPTSAKRYLHLVNSAKNKFQIKAKD